MSEIFDGKNRQLGPYPTLHTHAHTPHTHTPTHPTRKSRRNYCTKGTTKEGEIHNDNIEREHIQNCTVHYTTTNINTLLYLTIAPFHSSVKTLTSLL